MNKEDMGGTCSTHGGMRKSYKFLAGKSDDAAEQGEDRRIILKWILEN